MPHCQKGSDPVTHACDSLTEKILAVFAQGISLTPSDIAFLVSSFNMPEDHGFTDFFLQLANADQHSFAQYLLFPDEPQQLLFEPLLDAYSFASRDEIRITDRVLAQKKIIHAHGSDGAIVPPDFRLPLSQPIVQNYIRRLKITKKIPSEIKLLIAGNPHFTATDQLRLQVKLRNAQCLLSGIPQNWLTDLLMNKTPFPPLPSFDHPFMEAFDFLLLCLAPPQEAYSLTDALRQKKDWSLKQMRQSTINQKQLAGENMETLLQRGIKRPYFDHNAAEKDLNLIDYLLERLTQ